MGCLWRVAYVDVYWEFLVATRELLIYRYFGSFCIYIQVGYFIFPLFSWISMFLLSELIFSWMSFRCGNKIGKLIKCNTRVKVDISKVNCLAKWVINWGQGVRQGKSKFTETLSFYKLLRMHSWGLFWQDSIISKTMGQPA